MKTDFDVILDQLLPDFVNKRVLMPHDVAREAFKLNALTVANHTEFVRQVAMYVQHHHAAVGDGQLSAETAFGEAKRILNGVFGDDPFQEGYNVALQMALSGAGGGMRAIFNALADQLRRQALQSHKEYVFNAHVDVLSQSENEALARAYFQRFGPVIRRFIPKMDEKTFASNVRAALEYHLQVVEEILRVARKM